MSEIIFKDVSKFYGDFKAVDRMDLHVRDKEFFVILGPSGAGKTTTLKMVAGVETISNGTISINDKIINSIPSEKRNVAMVFENYALYSHLSVFENIAFPLYASGIQKPAVSDVGLQVTRIASLLGIENLLGRKPSELSGGQRQRVALGRALIREPDVFLLDEPLSHLDAKIRHYMRSELKNLQDSIHSTIIYVTHDYNEALALGDRIAILNKGIIQQIGTPEEVYYNPENVFVAESLGDPPMNFLSGTLVDNSRVLFHTSTNGDCFIPVHPPKMDILKSFIGKEIVLGIRPQQVITFKTPEREYCLKGKVFVHEILGDEGILSVAIGENLFMILTKPDMTFSLDEIIYLTWDTSVINYFSPETGENLMKLSEH